MHPFEADTRLRRLATLAGAVFPLLFAAGCGAEKPYGPPPRCAPGTAATCAGADTLRVCVGGDPIEWACDTVCAPWDAVGHCAAGAGAGPARCVCVFEPVGDAPSCPAPARPADDHCACDSAERVCVPDPSGGGSRALAHCENGALAWARCECAAGDAPYCEEGLLGGQAVCRCEPCEQREGHCLDRECGDDGCGGSCGRCGEHEACEEGRCLAVPWCGDGICAGVAAGEDCEGCPADCGCGCGEECRRGTCVFTGCEGVACGPDPGGCGRTCGAGCGCGEQCQGGRCVFVACAFQECGFDAAGCGVPCGPGCDACHESCVEGRCQWFDRCAGRACGSDGCGGTCGACACGETCDDGRCVARDGCGDLECGADACGASCGTCPPGAWCDDGRCVQACQGTVCGAPGAGPLSCCTGEAICVGFDCCVPDDHWVCLDDHTRQRADSCGNRSEQLETCDGYCDPDTGFCRPCEAVCTWGVCRAGRCEAPVCGDGACGGGAETAETCPADCQIAPAAEVCRSVCRAGERRCRGRGTIEACADPDGDGCLTWEAAGSCPRDAVCLDGRCRGPAVGS
jgi:hypothetical protein